MRVGIDIGGTKTDAVAVAADGRIAESEREYLKIVGRAIGLSDEAVEERIAGFVR